MAIDRKLMDNLYRKAMGFNLDEEITEYSSEGEIIKKKVTSKYYPPDIAALKMYIELCENDSRYDSLSDEELENKKIKILEEIKENEINKINK